MGRTVAKVPLEVLSTNGRLAPFLTVHFADRLTCHTVHFLRERLRTDRTDASRGVTPKKRTAVCLPNRPLGVSHDTGGVGWVVVVQFSDFVTKMTHYFHHRHHHSSVNMYLNNQTGGDPLRCYLSSVNSI